MARIRVLAATCVVLLCACGGGARGPADCLRLGGDVRLGPTAGAPSIELDVHFVDVPGNFFAPLGVDFRAVAAPQPDAFPTFGGVFVPTDALAASSDVVGGERGGSTVVPAMRHVGSYLPVARFGAAPGFGSAVAFVQAPGRDLQCLALAALARLSLGALGPVNLRPLVPFGRLPPGQGVAYHLFDAPDATMALDTVRNADPLLLVQAPRVALFDNQKAAVTVLRLVSFVTEYDVEFEMMAPGLAPHLDEQTLTGVTLGVEAAVTADRRHVRLRIRPTAHAALVQLSDLVVVDQMDARLQIPIVQPAAEFVEIEVPDGDTVVLGGIKNLADDGQAGVPLLSKIPYVNRLFRSQAPAPSPDELIIFIRPRILTSD